jgi:ATP-dependent DNA helicase
MNIDYTPAHEKQHVQRLKTLVERSKIYTSILADKLLKQQAEARERGEELDRQKHLAENKAKKEAIIAAGATRKSSRTGTTENMELAAEHVSPKKTRAAATKGKKKNDKLDISQYFDNKELDTGLSTADALKQAQEEAEEAGDVDAGVTAVTKPSASARQPELVTGCVLRDYQVFPSHSLTQLAGLEWLISLYENGLNGILADEMGLGKTVQTIAFLAFLRSKGTYGPFLVAAPLSTLSNWINEFQTYVSLGRTDKRFAPEIPCILYHGDKVTREGLRKKHFSRKQSPEQFPIVVTSYEIIMNDRQFLAKLQWKFIIIDEGHRIKNLNCKLIRELKSYDSANRLLLTGTPLQNNLKELWSLLNFIVCLQR